MYSGRGVPGSLAGSGTLLRFGRAYSHLRPAVKLVALFGIVPPNHQLLLEAMRSGVQDFLPKPVNADVLAQMLAQIRQGSGRPKAIVPRQTDRGDGLERRSRNNHRGGKSGRAVSDLRQEASGAARFCAAARQRASAADCTRDSPFATRWKTWTDWTAISLRDC